VEKNVLLFLIIKDAFYNLEFLGRSRKQRYKDFFRPRTTAVVKEDIEKVDKNLRHCLTTHIFFFFHMILYVFAIKMEVKEVEPPVMLQMFLR